MNIQKSVMKKFLCAAIVVSLMAGILPAKAEAADVPVYHKIPPYQYKDIYETERVMIKGLPVEEVTNSTVSPVITKRLEKAVKFVIFNSTKQEVEQEVESQDGKLPDLNLIKNHNYIIFAEDSEYRMPNVYIWVNDNRIVNIKDVEAANHTYDYPEVTSLRLYKRASTEEDPKSDNRVTVNLKVLLGEGAMFGVNFRLVSDVETIEQKNSGSGGQLVVRLLEDVTYMVTVENDDYAVEPFPIAAKDKSEYAAGRYAYDHSDCHQVTEIHLIPKGDVHKNDTTVTSLSENTEVTGMNFKDLIVVDKELDKNSVQGLEGKDYKVIDIKTINPHRGEVSKLAVGEFKVSEKVGENRIVGNVYINEKDGLRQIDFEQVDDTVNFTMDSMSLYPVVIEYNTAKEALKEAISEKAELDESDYTEDSWKAYNDAIEEAKILLEKNDATNAECEEAIQKITDVKVALVISESVTPAKRAALEEAIKGAEEFNASDYTEDSWKTYSDAIEEAKTLLERDDATNAEYKEAIRKITEAKAGLKVVEEVKPVPVVQNIKVTKVAVSGISKKIAAGKKVQLTAKVTPENATNKGIKWTTSNKKYATVSSTGKVTVKKAGVGKTVKITAAATDGSGKKAVYQIKVMKNAVKSINLKGKNSVKAGKKVTVKATVKTNGKKANKTLKWTSSNTKYATVSSKGKVTTKKAGKGKTVKITAAATDGSGKKKTIKIKIK